MKTFAALVAAGVAASASAQSLDINIVEGPLGSWTASAVLNAPTGTIRAVIADLAFTMTGAGLAGFSYNSAFDSTFFGPATVTASATQIDFSGANTLPPLANPGGPDASNPLALFTVNGNVTGFTVNGQMTGAYVGVPFDTVFFYQTAAGGSDVPFSVNIIPIPAPASAALLGLGGLAAIRRRR